MSDLAERLARVEAELAVRKLVALYGMAADCGDVATALLCHAEDAVNSVSNPDSGREGRGGADLELRGHHAIRDMLQSDRHQSLLPHCAHTVGPLHVQVKGRTANVLGYSRVYGGGEDGQTRLMRLAVNRWTLRQFDDSWKITRRESRVVGEPAAQDMLRAALADISAL